MSVTEITMDCLLVGARAGMGFKRQRYLSKKYMDLFDACNTEAPMNLSTRQTWGNSKKLMESFLKRFNQTALLCFRLDFVLVSFSLKHSIEGG